MASFAALEGVRGEARIGTPLDGQRSCRRSSEVEHVLGKDGVGSSILLGSTIFDQ
jgi:hypothetical protein